MTNLEQALQNGFGELEPSPNLVSFHFEEYQAVMFGIREKVPGEIKHHGFCQMSAQGGNKEAFWAIDEHGQCWANGYTGTQTVYPVNTVKLLESVGNWEARNNIQGCLGMKLEMPPWALEALKNGFELPPSFPVALYDYTPELKVDKVLKIPGFRACTYHDGRDENKVAYTLEPSTEHVHFCISQGVLPGRIVKSGKTRMERSTYFWAIDENRQVWMQNPSQDELYAVRKCKLLNQLSPNENKEGNEVRKWLGLPKKLTIPQKQFLKDGWTPPVELDLSEYDLEGIEVRKCLT